MNMNPDVKAKWVAALRSGKYTQTKHKLHSGEYKERTIDVNPGHCCLGVLCEISKQETGFGIEENRNQAHSETIGETIRTWAGLNVKQGATVLIDGEHRFLSYHNDHGKTFLQIADAIESQL